MKHLRGNERKTQVGISGYLWKNYLFIILAAAFLMLVPYLILVLLSNVFEGYVKSNQYTAQDILSDGITDTELARMVDNNGSIDRITKDLTVVHIAGDKTIPADQFTWNEYTKFLTECNEKTSDYHRDIVYDEKEESWLIVTFPISLTIELNLRYNQLSNDFDFFAFLVLSTIGIYFILVIVSAVFYARRTSYSLVQPLHQLQEITRQIEQGTAMSIRRHESEFHIRELEELSDTIHHMAGQLESQKELAVTMQENKKLLLRDIAHDLKNPLASIRGYAELYCGHPECDQEKKDQYVEVIHKNSIRANEMIISLFEYSKVDSADFQLQLKPCSLNELLRIELAEYIAAMDEQKLKVDVEIPEDDIVVNMDSEQMKRVFANLFDNLLKYHQCASKVEASLTMQQDKVEIRIADDGIGMSEEMAEHCFEPFMRADQVRNSKNGGSGLGLAIVKKIVEAHKGSISVVTSPGQGCAFHILLPC